MRDSTRAIARVVMIVTAAIATSCGGQTDDQRLRQDGSGSARAGDGSGASPSASGSGGSAPLDSGAGGMIGLISGSDAVSNGGSADEGVQVADRCSDLRNDADTVTLRYVAEAPPTALGGTPAVGLYHLTQWELFTGIHGRSTGEVRTRQQTIAITGAGDGRAEVEAMFDLPHGELAITYQWNETLTFDGNAFTSTPTCRTHVVSVSDSGGLYTATDDQLMFIKQSADSDGIWVLTYTLQ